ncbi:MAG: hypothetical protein WCK08_11980 [Betaproteobacteria bacterium]
MAVLSSARSFARTFALAGATRRVRVALSLLAALLCASAWADDRPFLRTTSAAVDDDDERTFELHIGRLSGKKISASRLQMGYSISPTLNVEIELESIRDRIEDSTTRDRELALWVSWVDPHREGWGLASRVSAGQERESGQGLERSAMHPYARGVTAVSLPLVDKSLWLHANVGAQWGSASQEMARWRGVWSLAGEYAITRRTSWFAELAATGHQRLSFAGVRQWLRKGKAALDLGTGRQTVGQSQGQFVSVSFSLYDLSP